MNMFKRTLACLLAVLMMAGMLSTSAFAATPVTASTAGDVNSDGNVDLLDVLIALRLIAGNEYNGKVNLAGMFVTGDTHVDISDAVLMLRAVAGWTDVVLTPPPANIYVLEPTAEIASYHYGAQISILSQNLLHSNSLGVRDECFQTEVESYKPDVIAMQEYRGAWEYRVAGADSSSALASMTKVKSIGNNGEVLSSGHTLYNNEYNYVINTTSSSVLGTGYQGYVQTRADITKEIYTEAKGIAAMTEYKAAKESDSNADPMDYAPHVDESLAIYWNTEKLELVNQGRFIISEDGSFSANPGKDPQVTFKNANGDIVSEDEATIMYFGNARLCVWVRLKDKTTGTEFYVFNAHGPNVGDTEADVTREMIPSMEIVRDRIADIVDGEDISVMLTGDLNVNYGEPCDLAAWAVLEEGFNDIAVQVEGDVPQGTRAPLNDAGTQFSGIETDADGNWRITIRPDYIFALDNGRIVCEEYKVNLDVYSADGTEVVAQFDPNSDTSLQGKYVSDHFGIYGEFNIA